MPADYVPILILVVVAVLMSAIAIALSALLGPRKPSKEKLMPYESGMVPVGDATGVRFSIKFYAVAILFLLFDVEAIFLYPWAVNFKDLGVDLAFVEMLLFLAFVLAGFYYVIRKGALNWEK